MKKTHNDYKGFVLLESVIRLKRDNTNMKARYTITPMAKNWCNAINVAYQNVIELIEMIYGIKGGEEDEESSEND